MPSVTFTIVIHPQVIEDLNIALLLESLQDFSPVLSSMGKIMSSYQRQNFGSQGETFNDPWKPVKQKSSSRMTTGEPLVHTGVLRDSIGSVLEQTDNSIMVGTSDRIAQYQHYGTRHIPARILVGLTSSEVQEMRQLLIEYLLSHSWTMNSFNILVNLQQQTITVGT